MSKKAKTYPARPGYRLVCVKSFKHYLSGKIIRAADHGLKAFCFYVRV